MHKVQRSVLVSHSRAQMFDLVADVASYPDFMPWCGGAIVHKHDEHGMEASITISIAGIKQTFTTRTEHDSPNLINFHLIDEVGREKCRERVCQTVEISVGAVAFKKKTYTKR